MCVCERGKVNRDEGSRVDANHCFPSLPILSVVADTMSTHLISFASHEEQQEEEDCCLHRKERSVRVCVSPGETIEHIDEIDDEKL